MIYAIVGYAIIILMMFMILKKKATPAFCFSILPVIGALICGFSFPEILEFINKGMGSVWKTAILFIFSVCYFSVMNDAGLFEPLVKGLVKMAGSNITLIMIATSLIAVVAHMDGACASTYLITIPVMLPIFKKMKLNPLILLLLVGLSTGVMNLVPWGGPTMRAASVANIEVGDLYSFMIPGVICLALIAFGIALIVSKIEKKHGAGTAAEVLSEEKEEQNEKKQGKKGIYVFNLILTLAMLVLLFMDTPLPLYSIFMIAFAIALIVNYPNAKQQNKKIKEYGTNAMVMTVTLFSVGVFMGVIKDSGMVEAMANTIVAVLPSAIAPHMHWFMCLFSVPLLMVLGTDAFYYALLPIIIGVVEPFGVTPETVAAAFLLTATLGTPVSPSVAAVYVGLGLSDVSIGEHIKYSLRLVWPASIVVLVLATVIGVIKF